MIISARNDDDDAAVPGNVFFSEWFDADAKKLEDYGALDISVVSDLPMFIDLFLLFNSDKPEYQALHESIIEYLWTQRRATPSSSLPRVTTRAATQPHPVTRGGGWRT